MSDVVALYIWHELLRLLQEGNKVVEKVRGIQGMAWRNKRFRAQGLKCATGIPMHA